MSDFTPVSAEDAIAAATASAFTDDQGRSTVHSIAITSGFMLGANWDLHELVQELRAAKEVMWFDDPMGHNLALLTQDGRAYKFEVKRPADASVKDFPCCVTGNSSERGRVGTVNEVGPGSVGSALDPALTPEPAEAVMDDTEPSPQLIAEQLTEWAAWAANLQQRIAKALADHIGDEHGWCVGCDKIDPAALVRIATCPVRAVLAGDAS